MIERVFGGGGSLREPDRAGTYPPRRSVQAHIRPVGACRHISAPSERAGTYPPRRKRLPARPRALGVSENSQNPGGDDRNSIAECGVRHSRNRWKSPVLDLIDAGLENRYGPDWSIEGSNPSPSAWARKEPA